MANSTPAISYSQCKNCARPSCSASCWASSRHVSVREVKARRRAARSNLSLGRAPATLAPQQPSNVATVSQIAAPPRNVEV